MSLFGAIMRIVREKGYWASLILLLPETVSAFGHIAIWEGRKPFWTKSFPSIGKGLMIVPDLSTCNRLQKGNTESLNLDAVAIWNSFILGKPTVDASVIAYWDTTVCEAGGRKKVKKGMDPPQFILFLDKDHLNGLHVANLVKYQKELGIRFNPRSFRSIDPTAPAYRELLSVRGILDTSQFKNVLLVLEPTTRTYFPPLTNAIKTYNPGSLINLKSEVYTLLYARTKIEEELVDRSLFNSEIKVLEEIYRRLWIKLAHPDIKTHQMYNVLRVMSNQDILAQNGLSDKVVQAGQEVSSMNANTDLARAQQNLANFEGSRSHDIPRSDQLRNTASNEPFNNPEAQAQPLPLWKHGQFNIYQETIPRAQPLGDDWPSPGSRDNKKLVMDGSGTSMANMFGEYKPQPLPDRSALDAAIADIAKSDKPFPQVADYYESRGPDLGKSMVDNVYDEDLMSYFKEKEEKQKTRPAFDIFADDADDDLDFNKDRWGDWYYSNGEKKIKKNSFDKI